MTTPALNRTQNTDLITKVRLPAESKEFLKNNNIYFKKLLHKDFSNNTVNFTRHDLSRIEKAYETAHRIRDFEINLYWQRLNYLWVITALLLAGWGVLASKALDFGNKTPMFVFASLCVMSLAGCVFSLLSIFITEAGKHWQRVWEEHIYRLEPFISGSLYSIKFQRQDLVKIPSISKSVEKIMISIFSVWALSLGFSACLTFGTIQNPAYGFGAVSLGLVVAAFFIVRGMVIDRPKEVIILSP
ncbi:RipA family octameric membrane protein [Duffyella gerundensis]|uniref:RipA family octameric membrane protein n=1 Tax=Duffyella TaxID=3026546 RepID=UPI003F6E1DED